jgi:hypothetical protein
MTYVMCENKRIRILQTEGMNRSAYESWQLYQSSKATIVVAKLVPPIPSRVTYELAEYRYKCHD